MYGPLLDSLVEYGTEYVRYQNNDRHFDNLPHECISRLCPEGEWFWGRVSRFTDPRFIGSESEGMDPTCTIPRLLTMI